MDVFTSSLLFSLTQSKNPIHLLLDLAGRENGLCRYGAVILPFLVLETEDVTKTDVADV